MVVDESGQQVGGGGHRVEVPGEVQVELLHGDHLGVPAAGGTTLDPERRAQGGLPDGHHSLLAEPAEGLR